MQEIKTIHIPLRLLQKLGAIAARITSELDEEIGNLLRVKGVVIYVIEVSAEFATFPIQLIQIYQVSKIL